MAKAKTHHKHQSWLLARILLISSLLFLILLIFLYTLGLAYYHGQIYPGVKVAGQNLGGQTPNQAISLLDQQFTNRVNQPLELNYHTSSNSFSIKINTYEASPSWDLSSQVDQAFQIGRTGNYFLDLIETFKALEGQYNFQPNIIFANQQKLIDQLTTINQAIKTDPVDAIIKFDQDQMQIIPSQTGSELDQPLLLQQISNYLTLQQTTPETLPTKIAQPNISTAKAESYRQILTEVKDKPIKLHYQNSTWTIDQPTLYSLLDLSGKPPVLATITIGSQIFTIEQANTGNNTLNNQTTSLDKSKLATYLQKVSTQINQPAKDAKFTYDPATGRATEFQAAQEGHQLDIDQTANLIMQALTTGENSNINLPVKVSPPKVTTASVNDLGIKDLLGEGVSNFAGSITNRIYNLTLAASRVNGVLVAPGDTFSFNQTVGEIDGSTGYKPAYVIKSGRTVLDDGGGVCQVSTTLFRALLNAGLPITDRTAHAYRVGYYEQGFPPGLDATVFAPTVDLKFKNDTAAYILIQSRVVGHTLYFDLYGTADGRQVSMTKPKITNQTPPPPDLRQDDPTLPVGEVKQVDWAAWGANVSFSRTVTRNGDTLISETWKSNYRPWQAVYLVGTK
ncbi:MAG: VanW family protein [Patescibacteria group bacterium]|nr:VanW family protein [Patescibacteria group bacterium]